MQFDLCFSGLQALKTPPALRTFPHPMRRCGRGRGLPGPLCRRPVLLRCLRRRPAPQPGTLRWARFLPDEKSGKESLRAFPPKDLPGVRGWNCVKEISGPSPLLWLLFVPPHQAPLGNWPYSQAVFTSGPTLVCAAFPPPGAGLPIPASPKPPSRREPFAVPSSHCLKLKSVPHCGTPQLFILHYSLFISHSSSRRSTHSRSPAPLSGGWAETRPPQSTPSPHPQCGTPSGCPG